MRLRIMKLALVAVTMIGAMTLTSCSVSSSKSGDGSTIIMTASSFNTASITVKAGTAVKFVDQPTAATHFLVIGTNGAHADVPNAPTQLEATNGMEIDVDQTVSVVFPTAGTYPITCTIHPGMNATVIVQA